MDTLQPVSGVTVSIGLTGVGGGDKAVTDENGFYVIHNIVPGLEDISITSHGSQNGLIPGAFLFVFPGLLNLLNNTDNLNLTLPQFVTFDVSVVDQLGKIIISLLNNITFLL